MALDLIRKQAKEKTAEDIIENVIEVEISGSDFTNGDGLGASTDLCNVRMQRFDNSVLFQFQFTPSADGTSGSVLLFPIQSFLQTHYPGITVNLANNEFLAMTLIESGSVGALPGRIRYLTASNSFQFEVSGLGTPTAGSLLGTEVGTSSGRINNIIGTVLIPIS